jgi:hypothetical protein
MFLFSRYWTHSSEMIILLPDSRDNVGGKDDNDLLVLAISSGAKVPCFKVQCHEHHYT